MLEIINEPIDVVCRFTRLPDGQVGNNLIPAKFLWQNREILVKKVNLAYSSWEGRSKIYYFAVSDGANYFKLQFNSDSLNWILLETYVE